MQTLFIYGPPGSGKTTLGKLLAGRFGVPFEDLDDSIVRAADGKSIPAIFADEGEAGFRARERAARERERRMQEAVLSIRRRFGKNAVIRASSLRDEATGMERNGQIGGHRA